MHPEAQQAAGDQAEKRLVARGVALVELRVGRPPHRGELTEVEVKCGNEVGNERDGDDGKQWEGKAINSASYFKNLALRLSGPAAWSVLSSRSILLTSLVLIGTSQIPD